MVLGDKVRTDLKLPEDSLGTFIQLGGEWFKIVGVMEPRGEMFGQSMDDYVVIPFETGRALRRSVHEPDMQHPVTVDDLDAVEDVKQPHHRADAPRAQDRTQRSRRLPGQSSQSITETIQRVSGTITLVISAVVGISLLVGGVGIMNIMLVSVTERTREIGIAKALGAPRSFILMQFLIEAMVLAVIGGIIGIAFRLAARCARGQDDPALSAAGGAVVGDRRRHGFLRAGRHDVWHPAGAPRRQPRAHRRIATRVNCPAQLPTPARERRHDPPTWQCNS